MWLTPLWYTTIYFTHSSSLNFLNMQHLSSFQYWGCSQLPWLLKENGERCWSHVSQFPRVNLTILLKYSLTQSSSSKDGISLCCFNSVTPENRSCQKSTEYLRSLLRYTPHPFVVTSCLFHSSAGPCSAHSSFGCPHTSKSSPRFVTLHLPQFQLQPSFGLALLHM